MSIKDISGLPQPVNKSDKNNSVRKAGAYKQAQRTAETASSRTGGTTAKDSAQISSVGRQLLGQRSEAAKYVKTVGESQVSSKEDIKEIRKKIVSRDYLDSQAIDNIVNELIGLPNFIGESEEN